MQVKGKYAGKAIKGVPGSRVAALRPEAWKHGSWSMAQQEWRQDFPGERAVGMWVMMVAVGTLELSNQIFTFKFRVLGHIRENLWFQDNCFIYSLPASSFLCCTCFLGSGDSNLPPCCLGTRGHYVKLGCTALCCLVRRSLFLSLHLGTHESLQNQSVIFGGKHQMC